MPKRMDASLKHGSEKRIIKQVSDHEYIKVEVSDSENENSHADLEESTTALNTNFSSDSELRNSLNMKLNNSQDNKTLNEIWIEKYKKTNENYPSPKERAEKLVTLIREIQTKKLIINEGLKTEAFKAFKQIRNYLENKNSFESIVQLETVEEIESIINPSKIR